MAAAHVQSTGLQSTGAVASLSKAFTSNVTGGNFIGAAVASFPSTGGSPRTHTVADGIGNSLTSAIRNTGVSGETAVAIEVYGKVNITGGASTMTVTPNNNAYMCLSITEVSGLDTASSTAHKTASADETDSSPSSGNLDTTSTCFMLGATTHNGTDTTITPDTGGGWATAFEDEDTSEMPLNAQWKIAASGANPASWTLGANRNTANVAAAWIEAAAGGRTTKNTRSNPLGNEAGMGFQMCG